MTNNRKKLPTKNRHEEQNPEDQQPVLQAVSFSKADFEKRDNELHRTA
jgi:hypothetical protein